VELGAWQDHLDRNYALLRKERSSLAPDRPIFALEHGLDIDQRADLACEIRKSILRQPPSPDHALAWTVYASEIGYGYAGEEYWQTFEADTPGWTENGDRYWIRECFIAFHQLYGGAKPTGQWAQHFSIICWPITHAVLPCDLQRQFAQLLYDLRHTFTDESLSSPQLLGEHIADRSGSTSSRFQQFAQEP
jgi:hypothetical protein